MNRAAATEKTTEERRLASDLLEKEEEEATTPRRCAFINPVAANKQAVTQCKVELCVLMMSRPARKSGLRNTARFDKVMAHCSAGDETLVRYGCLSVVDLATVQVAYTVSSQDSCKACVKWAVRLTQ